MHRVKGAATGRVKTSTTEAQVKRLVRAVLEGYRDFGIYWYMPVPGGYGRSSLDYLGFLKGRGFAIETKRPDGKVTERQEGMIQDIEASGCPVFIIRDDQGLRLLDQWLARVVRGEER